MLRKHLRCLVFKQPGCWLSTPSLRDEDRNVIASRILLQHRVSRPVVRALATPFIHVQGVEVRVDTGIVAAGHVILKHRTKTSYIRYSGVNTRRQHQGYALITCRIANRDLAVVLRVSVCLHISQCSLHIGGSSGSIRYGTIQPSIHWA